jgi:hypothetical protein
VKGEMNETHPVIIEMKEKRDKKLKRIEKEKINQQRLSSLSSLHQEASEWWIKSFSEALAVPIRIFKINFLSYLKTEMRLNTIVAELLLIDIETELDSDKNGSVDLIEFRNFLRKPFTYSSSSFSFSGPSNAPEHKDRSIKEYYHEFQKTIVDLDDQMVKEENLNELHIACMVNNFF